MHGLQKYWFTNPEGKVTMELQNMKMKRHGKDKFYDEKGTLTSYQNYREGISVTAEELKYIANTKLFKPRFTSKVPTLKLFRR